MEPQEVTSRSPASSGVAIKELELSGFRVWGLGFRA